LLVEGFQALVLLVTLFYLDNKALRSRNGLYTRALGAIIKEILTMNRKNKIIFYSVLGVFILAYIFIAQKYGAKRDLKQFDIFFAAELRGSIERVKIKNHGVAFTLNNDINEYVFHPSTSSLNENHIFDHLAAPGDSLIKASKSDTMILVKDQKKYKYTFQQFKK